MDPSDKLPDAATVYSTAGNPTRGGDTHDAPSQGTPSEYEEELPVYLGLLRDLPPTTAYELPEDELHHIPEGNKDAGWHACLDSVEKYDKEACQTYREQIDTLLVFAGLFSAVVTAFAVESYQWLQDDPLETSVELLRDMVALLSQNLNTTAPLTRVASPRISDSAIARINTFWFLSLSLSLSAALVGILCKQWLREYERNVGQSPERALAVRHIRFQGLEYWKVGSIVMSVPIIMQIALAFFMVGIIELLWRLHTVVACCVTVVAGLTLVFFLATTFLPVIQRAFMEPQCAFKSPQAWIVLRIVHPVIERLFKAYGPDFSFRRPPFNAALLLHPADSWVTFDINWIKRHEHMILGPQCAFRTLAWTARNLGETHLSSSIWHCVWARWLRNRDSQDTIAVASLDIRSVAQSYPRLVPLSLNNSPQIRAQALVFQCSLRTDLPVETAIELFLRISPIVGVTSRWTRDATRAIAGVYQDLSIHISDGLAVKLFRIAEMQTHALLLTPVGSNPANRLNAALAFKDILVLIYRGSRLRNTLLAAMSGLALQWLRSDPPAPIASVAKDIFEDIMSYLKARARSGETLHEYPGIILVAKLALEVSHLWPDFVRQVYLLDRQGRPPLLRELLALLSDESRDLDQAASDSMISPHRTFAHFADGERSIPPAHDAYANPTGTEDVHIDSPGALASPVCRQPSQAHTCIEVVAADETAIETD